MPKLPSVGERSEYGGKAADLLARQSNLPKGWNIPPFLVLPTSVFSEWVTASGQRERIDILLSNLTVASIPSVSDEIAGILQPISLPDRAVAFARQAGHLPNATLAVRSSANVEDGAATSFAGVFETVLNVSAEQVSEAVLRVYRSAYGQPALSYLMRERIDPRSLAMGIIAQSMISDGKFGVAYRWQEESGSPFVVIEATPDDPAGVTAGHVGVDTTVICSGDIRTYPAYLNSRTLFRFEIEMLERRIVELAPSGAWDIEYAIREEQHYLLQIRALTRSVPVLKGHETHAGLGVCGGVARGKAKAWPCSPAEVGPEHILIGTEIEIGDVDVIRRGAGVVVEVGGLTGHVAILAREIGKPAIVGANGIVALVTEGEDLSINGDTGEVELTSRMGVRVTKRGKMRAFAAETRVLLRSPRAALLTFEEMHATLHHDLPDQLQPLSKAAHALTGRTIIEGSPDFWYAYGHLSDMSQFDSELLRLEREAIIALQQVDMAGLRATVHQVVMRGTRLAGEALQDGVEIARQYAVANLTFAYWRLMQAILFDRGERTVVDIDGAILDPQSFSDLVALQNSEACLALGSLAIRVMEQVAEQAERASGRKVSDYDLPSDYMAANGWKMEATTRAW